MKENMTGSERRKHILALIRESETPLSGTALGRATGVSRQVVVQDIALLRTEGYDIVSTARGYILDAPVQITCLFKTCHTDEQTEEELVTIVDLGGTVVDISVDHNVYGKMTAPLNIRNRRDVNLFMKQLQTGNSFPLMHVTSGYHFHKVTADSEEILDEIESALREKEFLIETLL